MSPSRYALPLVAALVICGSLASPELAGAQAFPVPEALWGDIQPADPPGQPLPTDRDSTDFKEFRDLFHTTQWWTSLDVENGYVFVSGGHNVETWDGRSNPAHPTRLGGTTFRTLQFDSGESFTGWPANDIDLPTGNDTLGAQVGEAGIGLAIYNFSMKATPRAVYQQRGTGFSGTEVYAATINGHQYAFGAMEGHGLRVYDMNAAQDNNTRCTDDLNGSLCPGVYKGRAGSRNVLYVDGVDQFVVASAGISPRGFEIWSFANLPQIPTTPKLSALQDEIVFGVALWRDGSSYYLAIAGFVATPQGQMVEGRIYDVSCIRTSCSGLGAPLWSQRLFPRIVEKNFVTFSRGNGAPYLYFGNENRRGGGPHREFLFEVSNPRGPIDLTPPGTAILQGAETDYWSWYYDGNPTGFGNVAPRRGKFNGTYFYRAGLSLFDIHQVVGAVAPQADFTWQSTASDGNVYPDVGVNFFDTSRGEPESWSWLFEDATPGQVNNTQSPSGVLFGSPGDKDVTLLVGNGVGSNQTTNIVTVLNPFPVVAAVTPNVTDINQCQRVTFSAQGVTGRPPLSYAWRVLDSGDVAVANGATPATFLWQTSAGTLPGSYRAELTVDGPAGTSSPALSAPVTVTQEDVPAFFAPTNDPFEGASVQFHVVAPGASEWRWNFGDGTVTDWISDPIEGPNPPPHVYQALGTYEVTVEVRDCAQTIHTSVPLSVEIVNLAVVRGFFRPNPIFGCNFTTNFTTGECTWEVGLPLPFVDDSTDAVTQWSYDWDGNGTFEDSGNTGPATSHIYASAGTFTPRLKVSAGQQEFIFPDEDPDHDGFTITVLPSNQPDPSISVSGPSSGTFGQPVSFTATARDCNPSPNGWNWSASGGSVSVVSNSGTQSRVNITWASTGTKSVRASNSACGTSPPKTISISGPDTGGDGVTARFSFSPPRPDIGQSVSFNASISLGSPTAYLWNFGDGTSGSGVNVQHAYAEAKGYRVTLTVSKPGSCGPFGCFDETTQTVVVGAGGSEPALAITGPSTGEVGQSINFAATASNCTPNAGGWNWSASGGVVSGTGAAVSVTWATPGQKTLTVTNTGCADAAGVRSVSIGSTGDRLEAIFSFSPLNPQPGGRVRFNASASRGQPSEFAWDFGDGSAPQSTPGAVIDHVFAKEDAYTVTLTVIRPGNEAGCFNGFCFDETQQTVTVGGDAPPSISCADGDPDAVCLIDGRFKVTVDWNNPRPEGGEGVGKPLAINPLPGQTTTGFFWFFSPNNTELIVKVLDGRSINGTYWFFYGALSDVEYTIHVEDLDTGTMREYSNPPFQICGRADTGAFPDTEAAGLTALLEDAGIPDLSDGVLVPLDLPDPVQRSLALPGTGEGGTGEVLGGTCEGDSRTLCLLDGRFEVQVEWTNQRQTETTETGVGRAIPGTEETGYFWFFEPTNIELVVKLLDAREINGKFWFFFGGLSDVEYKIFVTDTVEGTVREYLNPAFQVCGQADDQAFD